MTTFKEAADHYRKRLHMDGRLTKDTEQRLVTLEERFGGDKVEKITAEVIQQYVYYKYAGRAPATVNRNLNVLAAVLGHAEEMGMLKAKPRIRRRKGEGVRNTHLELDEIMPVVDHVRQHAGPLIGFVVLLLVDTGMRLGEALNLRWGDLKRDWITVRRGGYASTKTRHRMVPTSPRLLEYMTKYKVLPLSTDKAEDRIIEGRWNEVRTQIGRKLNEHLRAASAAVGCQCGQDLRVHDLRHTFAFLCASSGADLGDIKEMLGHQHVNVTMRYRGFVQTRAAEAIRKGMAANG